MNLRTISALLLVACSANSVASAQAADVDPLVTLAFVETDVRDALRLVARQCDVNVVISNAVEGTISLELVDATLVETLDAIVAVGAYHYERRGDIVTVQTFEERLEQRSRTEQLAVPEPEPEPEVARTLVLALRYVDAERIEPIVQSLLSEQGSVSLLKTSDHLSQERAGRAGGDSSDSQLQIGSRLTTSTVGEPAKSHTLVVVDVPARLAHIEQVVSEIDVRPPQVVIETRFVEIALDDELALGLDWSVLARLSGAKAPHTFPFGDSTLGSFGPNVDGGSPSGVFPAAPPTVASGGDGGLFSFGTLDFSAFSALLEMIQRETDVQLVSNPRIVVRDRHTATILVGERYPILSANVSEFGSVTEQLDHYEPIGVQLAVTPSVLGDEVELLVRPSTSSLGADVVGSTGLGVARINSRQIDTLVTVKDGQTVVIGGLITSREVSTETRVPVLGSLPVLGGLFRHDSTRKERVDLMVFLTVSVLQEHSLTAEQRELFDATSEPGITLPARPVAPSAGLRYVLPTPQY